jgi:hypothetical protein
MLPILSILTFVLQWCGVSTPARGAAANRSAQPAQKQVAKPQAGAKPAPSEVEGSIVVGKIGPYEITKKELSERLMAELYPYDSETYDQQEQPPDALAVLNKMLAEKAMMLEGRKEGLLKNELIAGTVKRFRERRMIILLAQRYVERYRNKITATPAEITQKMHTDKKLTEARAKAMVEQTKAGKILDAYYMQIYTRAHVKKLDQNYAETIQIYQRLLHRPKEARRVSWIQNSQIRNELTPREKNLVLAQYVGGKVTLEDWFETYCDIVPPRRPPIDTPGAVEEMLERALRVPLLIWEATSLGLDKDPDLLAQVRDYEDRRLLGEVEGEKRKEVTPPTTDEIIAYFHKNQGAFGTSPSLKVDLIWCDNLAVARKAKAELDAGKDFETVKQRYSLEKKSKPFKTYAGGEGLFWKELWAGQPGQVLGPLKGFYRQGIKWRLVKILEKTPGKPKEYAPAMESQIKNRMINQRGTELIARYGQELLKKYPHQVYPERIKDVNPLNIP